MPRSSRASRPSWRSTLPHWPTTRGKKIYGNRIFVRGLIEVGNRCKNDCYYCGIRRSNAAVPRYCLTPEEILGCCAEGHALGFRTFFCRVARAAFRSRRSAALSAASSGTTPTAP